MPRSANSVGTLRWMHETNGILRLRDRVRLIGQGVLFLMHGAPADLRRALGLQPDRLARFDLTKLRVPDSAASREAERLCAQVPPVVNHSYRSYVWAVILAAHDGVLYDEELLYVASLLHDIAFAEPPQYPDGRPRCFLVACAEAALKVGASAGWDERRSELAAELRRSRFMPTCTWDAARAPKRTSSMLAPVSTRRGFDMGTCIPR